MTVHEPKRPRIGIPWRTSQEEAARNLPKIKNYMDAVERAGGKAELLSLTSPSELERQIIDIEGFILPGSPADVDPAEYGAVDGGKCAGADLPRERADRAILSHAFEVQKPVLAICYGCQLLNVYLGGTLIQDLRTETGTRVAHRKKDDPPELPDDPKHEVRFLSGSQLARMAGATEAVVNSSHHQSIAKPGRHLRVTGLASDGIVESVEWNGDANWVIGVQWHPERMLGDALADRLFSDFVAAARGAHRVPATKA